MMRDQIWRWWHQAAQLFFGCVALVSTTLVCLRLEAGLATTAFAYLLVIVMLSLMGSFLVSAMLSIAAVGALNHFFAPALFNFRVDYPTSDPSVYAGFKQVADFLRCRTRWAECCDDLGAAEAPCVYLHSYSASVKERCRAGDPLAQVI